MVEKLPSSVAQEDTPRIIKVTPEKKGVFYLFPGDRKTRKSVSRQRARQVTLLGEQQIYKVSSESTKE